MDDLAAVLFDLDGTLCVHDQDPEALWARAFERAGVAPACSPADAAAVDVEALPTVETRREFFGELFAAAERSAGGDPGAATVGAVADAFVAVQDPAAVSFREGAREALAAARERHPVGLVTNGSRDTQTAKLAALGIRDAFDAEVYCDPAAGIDPKPDPTPLDLAVEDLGVDPAGALLVGDSYPADVMGARNAGVRSAWVPRGDVPEDPEPSPTLRVDSMAAVAALLGP